MRFSAEHRTDGRRVPQVRYFMFDGQTTRRYYCVRVGRIWRLNKGKWRLHEYASDDNIRRLLRRTEELDRLSVTLWGLDKIKEFV